MHNKVDRLYRLNDELSDPLTAHDLERLGRVVVYKANLDLAPIPRIDQTRGVEAGHSVLDSEPATWLHETGVALRQCNSDTRRY